MRTRVYIAGPMTLGVASQNVCEGMRAAAKLIRAGYAPLCPQLTHFMNPAGLLPHQTWLEVDLPWVGCADAVLRLPGQSQGADMEVDYARRLGIPVFDHLDHLLDHLPPLTPPPLPSAGERGRGEGHNTDGEWL